MNNLQKQIVATIALGVLSLVGGVFAHLALTDIYHGEDNLSLEWNVLRICALVFLTFISFTLFTLRKSFREITWQNGAET